MKLVHVTFSYEKREILRDMNLDIPYGSVICFVGASGTGKTTLLRGIAGLEFPTAGEIDTSGERFGMVFQENRLLLQMNALDNIAVVGTDLKKESRQSIQTLLTALFSREQLEQVMSNEPVSHLSMGMQRRIALARALYADNTCLLLDEAFTGLDTETKRRAMETVLDFRRGRTVVLATHDPEVIQFFQVEPISLEVWRKE